MAHDSVDQPSAQPQAWGRYALPLMLGFAVAGGAIGFVLESATGGADPAFAATLGGALGGVFGRTGEESRGSRRNDLRAERVRYGAPTVELVEKRVQRLRDARGLR